MPNFRKHVVFCFVFIMLEVTKFVPIVNYFPINCSENALVIVNCFCCYCQLENTIILIITCLSTGYKLCSEYDDVA